MVYGSKRKRFDWAGSMYRGRAIMPRTRRRYGGPGSPSQTNMTFGYPNAISNALSLGGSRSYTRTTQGRRTNSVGGVTQQHDMRRVYTKKRMPNYKKKPWKRFVKKVHAVAEKDLGSRTVLFSDSITIGNNTPGSHCCLTLGLYGLQSSQSWLNDLAQISALENVGNPTATAGDTTYNTTKYLFQSGVLDITIRNSTWLTEQTSTTFNSAATMELDVYEIVASKDFIQSGGNFGSLSTALNEGFSITSDIGGASTGISIQSRGATPFECSAGLGRFGIKVMKKTKYFVPGGGTITHQIRDPKRHVMMQRDMSIEQGANKPYLTKFVYLIGKVIPGFTLGTSTGTYQERIEVGCTRKYLYKIEGINEDRDRYITSTTTAINPA